MVAYEKQYKRTTSRKLANNRWVTRAQYLDYVKSEAACNAVLAKKSEPDSIRNNPEAPDCPEARQYLCTIEEGTDKADDSVHETGATCEGELEGDVM